MAQKEATLLLKIKETGAEALEKTKDLLGGLAKIAAAGFAAVVAGGTAAVAAYREQELASNQLKQAMINQGVFSVELQEKYEAQATALQKVTTFGDEAIISAQAQIQSYIGQQEVTEDLTKAVLDFSQAQGIDLKSAADLVGKSIGSTTNALGRYGIQIDSSATSAEKLTQVTQALNNRFGGQAEAAAKGLGSLIQLKNAMGDIFEVAGQSLAPIITLVAKELTSLAEGAQKNTAVFNGLTQIFAFLVKGASFVITEFVNLGVSIGGVFGTLAGAIDLAVNGQIKAALNAWKEGDAATTAQVEANRQAHAERMAVIDETMTQKKIEAEAAEKERTLANAQIQQQEDQVAFENKLLTMDSNNMRELEQKYLHEQAKNDAQFIAEQKRLQNIIDTSNNKYTVLVAAQEKEKALNEKYDAIKRQQLTAMQKFERDINSRQVQDLQSTLGTISTLQQSNNKALFIAGKAAASANIIISTAQGVAKALGSAPPPFNFGLAALVGAAGAVQLATVNGARLAEGGIVRATPGGIPAIIGEGGRDEAVIPLDESGMAFGATTINITVNGGFLGDPADAREFAMALDKELLTLRKNNESVAFDSGVF